VWQVVIDGSTVCTIPNNETVDLPVEAGHHAVQVTSMRFLASPKKSFEVAEGRVIMLSCRWRPRHPFIIQRSSTSPAFWPPQPRTEDRKGARGRQPHQPGPRSVVSPTFSVALEFAAGLLITDALLLRFVSGMFDRERPVTGAKAIEGRQRFRWVASRPD
jgi:hypothetical protein